MTTRFTIEEVRSRTYKSRDSWWTVLLVDPLSSRLVQVAAGFRWITPNRLTIGAFVLGLAAATCFAVADYPWLVAGAVLFHFSFVLDCMDGKVARLTGTGSMFGAWLDYIVDRMRVVVCAIGLMGGQYHSTGEIRYLLIGGVVIFLDMFYYLDVLEIANVEGAMRAKLAETGADSADGPATMGEPAGQGTAAVPDAASTVDVNRAFRSRFRQLVQFRNLLGRYRIRANFVSGIEFQMAVFIVGPLTALLIPVTLVAGALLLAFELLLIYRLWVAAKDFDRRASGAGTTPVPESATPTPRAA